MLVNYTSALKLTDVILQSHWNTHLKWHSTFGSQESSKKHIASGKDSIIDFTFKMNKLKPHICEWLHHAWTKMFKQWNMWLSKGGKN